MTNEKNHPIGVWVIAVCTAIVLMSQGVVSTLLVYYATDTFHISVSHAYLMYGTFGSLIFVLPLIGGFTGERIGIIKTFLIGCVCCVIGLLVLSIHKLQAMYFGLGIFTTGIGFFSVSCFVLPGKFYARDDHRLESGYTIFYLVMNVGFLIAGPVAGFLSTQLGYSTAFICSAIIALLMFIIYYFNKRHIIAHPDNTLEPSSNWHPAALWVTGIVVAAVVALASTWSFQNIKSEDIILFVIVGLVTIGVFILALRQKDKRARFKLLAFIVLCYVAIGFWALYSLEPSLLNIYILHNIDRHLFGFTIPAATYYSLDSFFVIVLGVFFAYLWTHLARKNKNPSLPTKFSMALLVMGCGFLVLIVGIWFANKNGVTASHWMVLCYAFLACAELLIAPIGMSMIPKLSPENAEGTTMGVWTLFVGMSSVIGGYMAQWAVVPTHESAVLTNPIYINAFAKIGFIAIGLGIIAAVLAPYIKRLIVK